MVATTVFGAAAPLWSSAEDFEPMAALKGKDYGKSRMRYGARPFQTVLDAKRRLSLDPDSHVRHRFEDFTLTSTGLQYKVTRPVL